MQFLLISTLIGMGSALAGTTYMPPLESEVAPGVKWKSDPIIVVIPDTGPTVTHLTATITWTNTNPYWVEVQFKAGQKTIYTG